MSASATTSDGPANLNWQGLAAPLLVVMILAMMVLPLPPFVLDLLFTFNIAIALLVMLVSLYTARPLDFAVFPTLLLITTLMRLSLNVASTRVVLMHGHTGPDAAGKVIESFGHFLVGGNFTVGLVVFGIMVVINFMVITKGAGRIAEVAARFTLDAMPGKQMAIDADLNAGLIGEQEARRRRTEIAQEADFFGAMDGASKFVRGDAVAGILILVINIVGGLAVGVLQHNLSISQAANNYILLAIGDGLVAQIPALIISTAAGLVVSRVGTQDIGQQMVSQLFQNGQAFYLTAAILGVMGLIPGMPHLPFIIFAAISAYLGWRRQQPKPQEAQVVPGEAPALSENQDATWEDVQQVDTLGLEVGYRLIPLVDRAQEGDLLKRIRALRRKFAQDVGFLPPSVHIRDNLELKPSAYRISLKGVMVGEGESYSGMMLAINPGHAATMLPGNQTKDPAFGLPAVWIEASLREQAQAGGYTVVDAGTVVATHISHVLQGHAGALLGRQETQQLLDHLTRQWPKLVEDLVPKIISLATLQRVLQNLLAEGVHLRDLRSVFEALAEVAGRTQDAQELTAAARVAMGGGIVQQLFNCARELKVIALDQELERVLLQAASVAGGDGLGLEPGLADTLVAECAAALMRQESLGAPPVLLVPDRLRVALARLARRTLPQLRVLAQSEIPENRTIRVTSSIGAKA
ncbi:MAG: flagellar biosynthesis protein FlhA [Betaproteobacteria bacterium]